MLAAWGCLSSWRTRTIRSARCGKAAHFPLSSERCDARILNQDLRSHVRCLSDACFFHCPQTPQELIDDGLYKALAIAFVGDEQLRIVSQKLLAKQLGAVQKMKVASKLSARLQLIARSTFSSARVTSSRLSTRCFDRSSYVISTLSSRRRTLNTPRSSQ